MTANPTRPAAVRALAAALLLSACPGLEPQEAGADPVADGDPEAFAPPAALVGTYQVTSHFDVPATVAAPGPLGESLLLLHSLSENPARALLDVADEAGLPALSTLRLVLPGTWEAGLEDWMNGYLVATTVEGTPIHDRIVALDDRIRSVLLVWDLRSTLALSAEGGGTHAPDALVFDVAGEPVIVPVDVTAPVTAGTGVTATVAAATGGAAPAASVGPHAMGIPFGHYALAGLDELLARAYGTGGIGPALRTLVGCAAMAAAYPEQCVGVEPLRTCVSFERELRELCEAAVDEAALQLQARILAVDFEAIAFASGTASAQGVAREGVVASATALSGGTWSAVIDLGQPASEAANATFSAVGSGPPPGGAP